MRWRFWRRPGPRRGYNLTRASAHTQSGLQAAVIAMIVNLAVAIGLGDWRSIAPYSIASLLLSMAYLHVRALVRILDDLVPEHAIRSVQLPQLAKLAHVDIFSSGTCATCTKDVWPVDLGVQCMSGHLVHIDCLVYEEERRPRCPICLK